MHKYLYLLKRQTSVISLNLPLIAFVFLVCMVDLFTRVIVYSGDSTVDFSAELHPVSTQNMLISEELKSSLGEKLAAYLAPVAAEPIEEEPVLYPTKTLSEQGGLQRSLFVGDLELELLAIAIEDKSDIHIFVKEVNAKEGTEYIRKFKAGQLVHGLSLQVISNSEVKFSHPELSSDIQLKMFTRNED